MMKIKTIFLLYLVCVVLPLYCAKDTSQVLVQVHINEFPSELVVSIFEKLDALSFVQVGQACRGWHAVAKDMKNSLLNKHTQDVCYAHEYQDGKCVILDDSDLSKPCGFGRIFNYEAALEDVISNSSEWAFKIVHDRHPKGCVVLKGDSYFRVENQEEKFFHFMDARDCSTSNSDEESEDDMRIVMGAKYYIEAAKIDCNYAEPLIESFHVLPSTKIHWHKCPPVIVKALRTAALRGNFEAVKYLVSKGADCTLLDSDNASLLHSACRGRSAQTVQYFIDKGLPIDTLDRNDYSPLAWAYWSGNYRGLECIIKAHKKQTEKDVSALECDVEDQEKIVQQKLKDFIHAQCNKEEIDEHFYICPPARSAAKREKTEAILRKYLDN